LCYFLALTACSPKNFSGERAVRTYSLSETADSAAVLRWLDKAVRESVEQHVQTVFDFDAVTVRETLSAPDSTGAQYVTSTSTTHSRGRSVSTSGTESAREERISEGTDSTAVSSTHGEAITERREKISGEVRGWIPWYVYVIALIGAVVIGLGAAIHGRGWWKFKS
jgi:cobalamin biosynthesis Mg chelatase CobN